MNRLRRQDGGFTLIELLTVIAIMALLAGILLPSVFAARQAAWKAKCANNLHNLGNILQHYATANKGWYIPRDVGDPRKVSGRWKTWFEKEGIHPEVLFCPNRRTGKTDEAAVSAWSDGSPTTDYEVLVGSDQLGNMASKWLRVDTTPTREMIAGDYMAKTGAAGPTGGWSANHTERLLGGQTGMPIGRNALFGDYHVEWVIREHSNTRVYLSSGGTYYLPDLPQGF